MNNSSVQPIRKALISLSDKSQLEPLAQTLVNHHIEIISTGGTFAQLKKANIPALEVSDLTQFPEILSGRVKTLHPNIHAGILARRGEDDNILNQLSIAAIDLVIVNLYPFLKTVTQPNCSLDTAIENIDIGGPTMIRAAAKNQAYVTVITDPNDYTTLMSMIKEQGGLSLEWRRHFAAKAFAHTAAYDAMIAEYSKPLLKSETLTKQSTLLPNFFTPSFKQQSILRYGENPHQQAAVYSEALNTSATLANTAPLQGKPLSYNNLADADAAYQTVQSFSSHSCVIVKHANPCGVAQAKSALTAYQNAFKTDPTSAFGGIIAFNCPIGHDTCQTIINNQFVEVLIAPKISQEGLSILATKPNMRVLCLPTTEQQPSLNDNWTCKRIHGGLLVQSLDQNITHRSEMQVVTSTSPNETQWLDLQFAWRSVKHVKSNAIVLANNTATVGIGAGQMSRSFSVHIAGKKATEANLTTQGCVLASDAFFPFKDGIEQAAELGVSAIIQPGGSIRDQDVIACANEHNIAMVFTGKRHFLH